MKVRVLVRLKPGILDVQGTSVKRALAGLGFDDVTDLRIGKVIEVDVNAATTAGARQRADEISPDGCRLWDIKTNHKLDKDRFRQDLGGVEEAYQEVARRLGLLQPEEESAVLDLDSHRKKRGR